MLGELRAWCTICAQHAICIVLARAVQPCYTLFVKQRSEEIAALGHVDLVKVRVNSQVMQSVIARATRSVLRPVIVR